MPNVELRDVRPFDLPIFFEQQLDPLAVAMAEFPSREEDAFNKHWQKILTDADIFIKTIFCDSQVAGNILSFILDGKGER